MKTGIISSCMNINGHRYFLVESSFEQGNSGSPVVHANTGEVIGVMTDCFSSLTEKHRKLKEIIDENIRMLENASGSCSIGDIDPVQVLTANQYILKHLAKEIYLSSQRNYGFAVPVKRLSGYIRNLEHRNQIAIDNGERIK